MKLLFDLSSNQSIYDGVTVYALRILKGFQEHRYPHIILLGNSAICDYLTTHFPEYPCIQADIHNENGSLLKNGWNWHRQVRKIDCDVIFSPNPYLTYFSSKRIIQTVHDLQPLKIYTGRTLWAFRIFLPLVLLRSHRLITITDFVQKEIKRIYPFISSRKMHTISNCVSVDPTRYPESPLPEKYLLYVSTLWEYKNIFTLLQALHLLKDQIPHKLVIIGKPMDAYWEKVCVPYIQTHHLEPHILHLRQPVSDQLLAQYYQFTDLFIHPSLLEGFGYPPIEAAIHRTPVLTTKETALYESTMGLLNYYEPATDPQALAQKIRELLANPPSAEKLAQISEKLRRQYDYAAQAEKVYQFLTQNTSRS